MNSAVIGPEGNFRQAGRRREGQIRRGFWSREGGSQKTTSIPARFETKLHPDFHEERGFGSSAFRFRPFTEEKPGPGAYYRPRAFEKSSDSFSKKGYGGLVSKSKRFNRRVKATPGPGAYEAGSTLASKLEADARRTNYIAEEFVGRMGRQFAPALSIKLERTQIPGPGSYDPVDISRHRHAARKAVPFSTSAVRFNDSKGRSGPAPGDYEVGPQLSFQPEARRPGYSGSRAGSRPGSRGGSRPASRGNPMVEVSRPFLQSGNVAPPALGRNSRTAAPAARCEPRRPESRQVLRLGGVEIDVDLVGRDFAKRYASHEAKRVLNSEEDRPGPGYYNPVVTTRGRPMTSGVPLPSSSMFAKAETDRFGNPIFRRTEKFTVPGPGEYHKEKRVRKQRVGSSAFKSGVSRVLGDMQHPATHTHGADVEGGPAGAPLSESAVRPPGPAYYSPKVPNKKNFHLNVTGAWH